MTDTEAVRAATDKVNAAAEGFAVATKQRDQAIRDAIDAGNKVTEIAEASGLSRERIYQIQKNRPA